jgi:glycosyltransferase involved in cell wall biosynthesis
MAMNKPELSCIIPSFNDQVNLKRAVDSALNQQHVEVEVIVVDDCSDPATRYYILSLCAGDSRIKHFFMPYNAGQSQARNIGAMLSSSSFITFLDQDDEHAPGWYGVALEWLKNNQELGAMSGSARVVDLPARLNIDADDLRLQTLNGVFATSLVLRKSVFMAIGGFPTGSVWRSPAAGEDGAFRMAINQSWHAKQCDHPALVHHAREGGSTVRYLDRTLIRDGGIIMSEPYPVVSSGELKAATVAFLQESARFALEIQAALH